MSYAKLKLQKKSQFSDKAVSLSAPAQQYGGWRAPSEKG